MKVLYYDGSFEGLLTAIFECYALKLEQVQIRKRETGATSLFGVSTSIETAMGKAMRVWNGLKTRTSPEAARQFYYNFLSELPGTEDYMLEYARYVFASDRDVSTDLSHPAVLRVARVFNMVGREKHRMEAFVRFRLIDGGIYHAVIEPGFNVLPLLVKHFQSRYANQRWVIWDAKRRYGLFYDLEKAAMIREPSTVIAPQNPQGGYAQLWKTYFTSTNIAERRNMKLHLQHVPARYWKYLSEKQP